MLSASFAVIDPVNTDPYMPVTGINLYTTVPACAVETVNASAAESARHEMSDLVVVFMLSGWT